MHGVRAAGAYVVEVHVDAAKVAHQEVPHDIHPLHGMRQPIIRFHEPGILILQELTRG